LIAGGAARFEHGYLPKLNPLIRAKIAVNRVERRILQIRGMSKITGHVLSTVVLADTAFSFNTTNAFQLLYR
jgi:hypothetical protein